MPVLLKFALRKINNNCVSLSLTRRQQFCILQFAFNQTYMKHCKGSDSLIFL